MSVDLSASRAFLGYQDLGSTSIALFLVFYLFVSSVVALIIPSVSAESPGAKPILYLALLGVCWILTVACYALTAFTMPGRVPRWYRELYPTEKRVHGQDYGPMRPRWCRKCNAPKPPRSHHCRTCDYCVLRMDHHCTTFPHAVGPWVSNCIGFYNHGSFVRFLASCLATLLLLLAGLAYISAFGSFLTHASLAQLVVFTVNAALCLALAVAIGLLLANQVTLMSKNMTWIEAREVEYAKGKLKGQIIFPYTHPRTLHNCKAFLGDSVLLWMVPWAAGHGQQSDGTVFYVRKDAPSGGAWPLIGHSQRGQDSDNEYVLQ